jgi:4-alpha-glucanotransferase
MEQGEAAVWVAFRLMDAPDDTAVNLQLHLWINHRDHHTQISSGGITPKTRLLDKRSLQVNYADSSRLHIQLSSGELEVEHSWINDFLLPHERDRGLPDRDNHLAIARASMTLNDSHWHGVRTGLRASVSPDPAAALQREQRLQRDYLVRAHAAFKPVTPGWIEQLLASSERFLFRRPLKDGGSGESVIAGYPWFADWGRDTMIALPGRRVACMMYSTHRRAMMTVSARIRFLHSVCPGRCSTMQQQRVCWTRCSAIYIPPMD